MDYIRFSLFFLELVMPLDGADNPVGWQYPEISFLFQVDSTTLPATIFEVTVCDYSF